MMTFYYSGYQQLHSLHSYAILILVSMVTLVNANNMYREGVEQVASEGHVARFPNHVMPSKRQDMFQDVRQFLREVNRDLKHAKTFSNDSLHLVRQALRNKNHVAHLERLPHVAGLTWEMFHEDPVAVMLLKIYNSLQRLSSFSGTVKQKLHKTPSNNPARRRFISLINQITQGHGSNKGLSTIMRDIIRQIPVIGAEATPATPTEFNGDVMWPSNADDISFRALTNIVRVLNGLTLNLDSVLNSNRDLRIYS